MHLLVICIIVFADQVSKNLALTYFENNEVKEIKKRFITFKIVKNSGAALGMFEKRRKLLIMINIILLAALTYFYIDLVRNSWGSSYIFPMAFILGGGLSNFIDRIRMRYVLDFFMFNINKSPVFNLADIFILTGTIMLQLFIVMDK